MMNTDTSVMQKRIGQLCRQFKLPTTGAQPVARFTEAGHGDALPTFLEVLEQEAEDRRHRRVNRLRQASKLPTGKTWETFEHQRMPLALRQRLDQLAQGNFVEHGVNVLAFGLPGTGKTHALCALGHRLVEAGHSVLFAPAYRSGSGTSGPGPSQQLPAHPMQLAGVAPPEAAQERSQGESKAICAVGAVTW